jgi:hypothetical protein
MKSLFSSAETSRHGTLGVQTGQAGRIYLILDSVQSCPRCRPVRTPFAAPALRDRLGHALAAFQPSGQGAPGLRDQDRIGRPGEQVDGSAVRSISRSGAAFKKRM